MGPDMDHEACAAQDEDGGAPRVSRRARIVRPRTENIHRISRRRLTLLALEVPPEDDEPAERPRTRGDCAKVPRPCPFVGCRHSLYLEVNPTNGSLKYRFPDLAPDEMPADRSCVLDVADRGPATLQEVGDSMNMVRERVRQIQAEAGRKVASAHAGLRALVAGGLDEDEDDEAAPEDEGAPEDEEEIPMVDKRDPPPPASAPARPEGREVEFLLPCALTPEEILARADQVARLHAEAAQLREKKKQATGEIGAEIARVEGEIGALVSQIRARSETRPVVCVEEPDFREGIVRTRRLDTRELAGTRPMTKADRQPNLFEITGGKGKRAAPPESPAG
jgi:Sigma-70, region 4